MMSVRLLNAKGTVSKQLIDNETVPKNDQPFSCAAKLARHSSYEQDMIATE